MASRFVAATLVFLAWCVGLHFLISSSVSLLVPGSDPFASFPFASVHLAEEALEGSYQPLLDTPFQIYVGLMCLVTFLLGCYWVSSRLRGNSFWLRLLPALAPLAFMALAMRSALVSGFAGSFRTAAIASLLLFGASSVIGALLYTRVAMPSNNALERTRNG